jgi:RNA polymerase sigma-70 factor (ECF subfamily)
MPALPDWDTEQQLQRVADGAANARDELLEHYRQRLRRAMAARLDHRLRPRLDASDVVQEVFYEAHQKLVRYLHERPLPFYPWLHRLATERLAQLYRQHVRAQRRTVRREEIPGFALSSDSAVLLAERLAADDASLSAGLRRSELRHRLAGALAELAPADCEVLVLRFLEDMSTREIAATLGIKESAVKMRQLRALQRLRDLLGDDVEEKL